MLETTNWHHTKAERDPKLLRLVGAALPEQLCATDLAGNTLLHYALKFAHNSSAICLRLLERYPAAAEQKDVVGSLPLELALARWDTVGEDVILAIADVYPTAVQARRIGAFNNGRPVGLAEADINLTMLSLAMQSPFGTGNASTSQKHTDNTILGIMAHWPGAVKQGYANGTGGGTATATPADGAGSAATPADGAGSAAAAGGGGDDAAAATAATTEPQADPPTPAPVSARLSDGKLFANQGGVPTVLHAALRAHCSEGIICEILQQWQVALL